MNFWEFLDRNIEWVAVIVLAGMVVTLFSLIAIFGK